MADRKKKKQELPELLSISQAAKALGISPSGISQAVHRGKLGVMRFGSVTLISRASLEMYVKSKGRPGRPRKKLES